MNPQNKLIFLLDYSNYVFLFNVAYLATLPCIYGININHWITNCVYSIKWNDCDNR